MSDEEMLKKLSLFSLQEKDYGGKCEFSSM